MQVPIAICILNYNGEKLLRQFLPPMVTFSPKSLSKIYVIDNCSTDGSLSYLRSNHPDIEIVETGQNLGFTGGYNFGLKSIEAQYYVLINSDVEVTPCWLEPLYELMLGDATIAACQPKIKAWRHKDHFEYAGACGGYIDPLGYPFCRGRIFDSIEIDTGQYDSTTQVFWASGACMFIRADLFHQVGGFDESFFAHMEEIDLCWRLQRLGYTIYCEPKGVVYHVGGETLAKENPKKTYLNFRNSISMLHKNTTDHTKYWKLPLKAALDLLAAFKLWNDNTFAHFKAVFKAYWDFLTDIKNKRQKKSKMGSMAHRDLHTIYPRLIVWDYFARKSRNFSKLGWIQ